MSGCPEQTAPVVVFRAELKSVALLISNIPSSSHRPPHFPTLVELRSAAQQQEDQEEKEEEDNEKTLHRMREWDDWKDTHPRGYGNRQNMG
jgi:hypothetical protein